jgi:hypothetical protein
MARFRTTIVSVRSVEDTFDYMADFANAREWDPATVAAERLDPGPPAVGSGFELTEKFLGRTLPMEYRIVDLDRPRRVVLHADLPAVRSIDTITVEPAGAGGSGSVLTYDAELRPRTTVARIFDPITGLLFKRLASGGAEGLRRELGKAGG